jgi:chromosome segregation ATPase
LTADLKQLVQRKRQLEDSISTKEQELGVTEALIDDVNGELEQLQATLEAERAKVAQVSREFADLSTRVASMKQDTLSQQGLADMARDDIAKRTRALDEREAVLRRRETAVGHLEAQVQQNAQLLNL